MLTQIEAAYRQTAGFMWEDKPLQREVAHALGGVGLGLLVYPGVARQARPLGYALLGLSALMHLYAFWTMAARRRTGVAGGR
ncbi:MAG: hypothetical protein HY690_04720 [Chloroflexi bacterium]|nr:hypothetical protein [Chloroflexota bacterium]